MISNQHVRIGESYSNKNQKFNISDYTQINYEDISFLKGIMSSKKNNSIRYYLNERKYDKKEKNKYIKGGENHNYLNLSLKPCKKIDDLKEEGLNKKKLFIDISFFDKKISRKIRGVF